MSTKDIDIFAGLRSKTSVTRRGQVREKFSIEFKAPQLDIRLDNPAIAKRFAQQLTAQIRLNADQGKGPDGTPLPQAKAATMERRRYRLEQAKREGSLSPRIKDKKLRRDGRRSYFKRFSATKDVGRLFPDDAKVKGRFGYESGTMLKGLVVAPSGNGSYSIFFPNSRGIQKDSSGSAVLRTFGRQGKLRAFSKKGMQQPLVKQAFRDVLDESIRTQRNRAVSQFIAALKQTASTTFGAATSI